MHNDPTPARRPWRTLVRVADTQEDVCFHVVVPAWNPDRTIRLRRQDVPVELHAKFRLGQRMHAQVNTGAEAEADLRFEGWEAE